MSVRYPYGGHIIYLCDLFLNEKGKGRQNKIKALTSPWDKKNLAGNTIGNNDGAIGKVVPLVDTKIGYQLHY